MPPYERRGRSWRCRFSEVAEKPPDLCMPTRTRRGQSPEGLSRLAVASAANRNLLGRETPTKHFSDFQNFLTTARKTCALRLRSASLPNEKDVRARKRDLHLTHRS